MTTYTFDPKRGPTGSYLNTDTGRVVPPAEVAQALEARLTVARQNIRTTSERLQQGAITLAEWQAAIEQEILIIHIMSGAAARGGWQNMSQADWEAVGRATARQYMFLEAFALDIEAGRQTLTGNFLRRADMYAQAARGTFGEIQRREARRNGLTEERRVRGAKDSCVTCIDEERKGWQPLGTLRKIGDSECRVNCKCRFEFR